MGMQEGLERGSWARLSGSDPSPDVDGHRFWRVPSVSGLPSLFYKQESQCFQTPAWKD